MGARVKLQDVIEAIDFSNESVQSYLNRDTGEIVTVTDDEYDLVEGDADADDGHDPEEEDEAVQSARKLLESDRFLPLPGQFDVHEWATMERFARGRSNARERDDLAEAIHGRGAFRMFKSAIRRLGIEEDWYRFREAAFEEIARDWLESNQIEYE